MKKLLLLTTCLSLSSCFSTTHYDASQLNTPEQWSIEASKTVPEVSQDNLYQWWKGFDDQTLNSLIETALQKSPDRLIAESKIAEARGIRRTARSFLFPQIGASATVRREDSDLVGLGQYPDTFYDAGFDASYELDIFGSNRNTASAADDNLNSIMKQYDDVSLTLIAEVARTYIDFRAAQNQARIAEKNLKSQEETMTLVNNLYEAGAVPKLDVERTSTLVNNTRASIPEYKRLEQNAQLRLSVLTGEFPENLKQSLNEEKVIPGADVQPVLMSPANIISLRPDIRAAAYNLSASTKLSKSEVANFFPKFNISGFYGITESALLGGGTVWNLVAGAAVSLLDFGRIEGQIDAANAREKQAFELYRKTVLAAVVEVETALNDYTQITSKKSSLQRSYQSADRALEISNISYREGEISFLDVLDAQRTANDADAALVAVNAAQSESLIRLYKSLGVY
ncbi:MAG: hypothetical protein CL565_02515 [Alphaproteobacteria bacterium]|nr:hypothetical protein [Alphaproteobacteria bacterium]